MKPPYWRIAAAGASIVLIATATWFGLGLLGQAPDQTSRVATLEAAAQTAARLAQARPQDVTVKLCRTSLETAMPELAEALRTDALASGNELGSLELEANAAPSDDIVAARLQMTLLGDDKSLLGFLRLSAERRHPLAIDRFEIAPSAQGQLSAHLEGRLLCRRGAQ